MKTLFPILLLLFTFCSCSSNPADPTDNSTSTPESPENQENKEKVFTDLNVEHFKAKMQDENVLVLDVRTPGETAEGIIEGAIEIDYQAQDFAEKIAALDKDKTYLVYCRSGGRSVGACNKMADKDFKSLYNLLGGYNAWKKAEE